MHLFKAQQESESLTEGLPDLFVGGWEPSTSNGISGPSWGRREENKDGHSVDLCWDRNARIVPLAVNDLTDEERDVS